MTDSDVEQMINDPEHFFKRPEEVLKNKTLTKAQKIHLLNNWKFDEIEREVAEQENMNAYVPEIDVLSEIQNALLKLEKDPDA